MLFNLLQIKFFILKLIFLNSISILTIILIFETVDCAKLSTVVIRKSRQSELKYSATSSISAVLAECPPDNKEPKCKRKLFINIRINPTRNTGQNRTYVIIDEAYNVKSRQEEKLLAPYLIEVRRAEPVLMYPLNHSLSVRCDQCSKNETKSEIEEYNKPSKKLNAEGWTLDNHENISEYMQKLKTTPVKLRPNIDIDGKSPVIKPMDIKTENKLPPMRKLPNVAGRPMLNPLFEFEATEKFRNSLYGNHIPFAPEFEDSEKIFFKRGKSSKQKKNSKKKKEKFGKRRKLSEPSDSSEKYEIFDINNPLPLLITQIRLFQRRGTKWFKIGPTAMISTLENNVNENSNISITLSSNDETFQSKRHTIFENHKVLIPYNTIRTVSHKTDKRYSESGSGSSSSLPLSTSSILMFDSKNLKKLTKKHGREKMSSSSLSSPLASSSSTSELIKRLCILSVCKDERQQDEGATAVQNEKYQVDERYLNGKEDKDEKNEQDSRQNQQFVSNDMNDTASAIATAVPDIKNSNKSFNLEIFSLNESVKSLPKEIDVLEKCKHDEKHLCLNILDDELPVYSVKLQFPFNDNTLIPNNFHKIRITDITTDATTPGFLQITANIINFGLIAHDFQISIENCQKKNQIKNLPMTVKKYLVPNIGHNLNFELDLNEKKSKKEYQCDILVKTINGSDSFDLKTVAKRHFISKRSMRCLCLWNCNCKCMKRFIPKTHKFFCQKLGQTQNFQAGFEEFTEVDEISYVMCIITLVVLLFFIALFLGLIKALLGICSPKVRKVGYNKMQPGRFFDSKFRKFFINILFFISLPFMCCVSKKKKCADEEKLLERDYWEFEVIQHKININDNDEDYKQFKSTKTPKMPKQKCSKKKKKRRFFGGVTEEDEDDDDDDDDDNDDDEDDENDDEDDDEDEETILSQRIEKYKDTDITSMTTDADNLSNLRSNNEEEAVRKKRYEYFNTQDGHFADDINDTDLEDKEAALFVQQLIDGKIVYRTFYHPIGGIDTEDFQQYSIRGYFIMDAGKRYKFITPIPTRQYFRICAKTRTLGMLQTPNLLNSNALSHTYANRKDVFRQANLSLEEPDEAPCINYMPRGMKSPTVSMSPAIE